MRQGRRKEDLVSSLRAVVADAEDLLDATADQTGERIETARAKAGQSLAASRARLERVGDRAQARAREYANGLLLGIIIGAGGLWFYFYAYPVPSVQAIKQRARAQADNALESSRDAAEQAKQVLAARLDALELDSEGIRKELDATGKVARRRARDLGDAIADATADAETTAAVKTRLAADPELSSLNIAVDTTAGRVALSGDAAAPDLIGRAIKLTLQTPGVHTVVSTLQVTQAAAASAADSGRS